MTNTCCTIIVIVGKERRTLIDPWGYLNKQHPLFGLYRKDYWPCAGGLSAVNVSGTQLRDQINSGLIQCRLTV